MTISTVPSRKDITLRILENVVGIKSYTSTSTSKPFIDAETTKSSIAAVKTSEPAADRERRIETIPTTPIVSQSNQVRGKMLGSKPLPSKKSWKNRLSYNMEPSVKVIKREPSSTTNRSILSYFGI